MASDTLALTPNQIVARNIAELRRANGWTQRELVDHLEPYLGVRWSVAVLSAAERSAERNRVREFSANELVALARVFGVVIGRLFWVPDATRMSVPDRAEGLESVEVAKALVGLPTDLAAQLVDKALAQVAASVMGVFQDRHLASSIVDRFETTQGEPTGTTRGDER